MIKKGILILLTARLKIVQMSKGIQKPSFEELRQDLISILEIEDRVNSLDIIRLKELLIFIRELNSKIFSIAYEKRKLSGFTSQYSFDNINYCGFKYDYLDQLGKLIKSRVSHLSEKQNDTIVFKPGDSESFFNYLVDKWLKEETYKVSALRQVFSEMSHKNSDKETPYKITCGQTYFAREYWNKNFEHIFKIKNPKNPKLNDAPTSKHYYKRFKKHLDDYQGGLIPQKYLYSDLS